MTSQSAGGIRRTFRIAIVAGLSGAGLAFAPPAARALDPARAISQYSMAVWRTEDGLPQDSLTSVVEDRDGRLWLGTPAGLVSFDGREFRRLEASRDVPPADRYVTALLARDGGGFWATTRGDLLEVAGGSVRRHPLAPSASSVESAALIDAGGGALWLASTNGLLRFAGGQVAPALDDRGRPVHDGNAYALAFDSRRRLHVATDRGLLAPEGDGYRLFSARDGLPGDLVSATIVDLEGVVWIGTSLGLARLDGGRISVPEAARPLAGLWIRCLAVDRAGNLWIGTRGNGLFRLAAGRLDSLTAAHGLPNDLVRQIYEDRSGALWVATAGGLARLSDGPVTTWTTTQGLPGRFVWSVHEDPRGTLWIGTSGGGVARLLDDGGVAPAPFVHPDLLGVEIRSFLTDRHGTLWIGTGGNGIATVRGGRLSWIRTGESAAERWIQCLLEDRGGRIWAGTAEGLVRIESDRVVERYSRDGASRGIVRSLAEGADGTIWVGLADGLARLAPAPAASGATHDVPSTFALLPVAGAESLQGARVHSIVAEPEGALWLATDGGLARCAAGACRRWTTTHGLPIDMLYWLIDDGEGNLWASSDLGLVRLAKRQIDELERGARSRLEPLVLGRADGMLATECNSGFPAGARRRGGDFCFATTDGVSCVDPSRIRALEEPPRVELDRVLVDGAPEIVLGSGADSTVVVRRGARRIELGYAAVAPAGSERVAYRYRLEGFDPAWVDAGGSRSAQLTGLGSGRYNFAVAARRGAGPWSPAATLRLEIEPEIYETAPFHLAVAALLAVGVTAAVRLRTRRLARRALELEREVAQRTAELGRLNAELERQSLADGLTRIANRRHFDNRLDVEWRRAQRAGTSLALILADLDHFKAFNDAHGHIAGDECLKSVTAALVESVNRADDLVARYGGEELAILLPGSRLADATELAERLRARIEALDLRHDRSPLGRITLSLGVAALIPDVHSLSATLVEAADQALYRAKNAGRNRVAQ